MSFFTHINEDGTECLATMIDGEKVLIDKPTEAEFYKDIKKRARNKRKLTKPRK